MLAASWVNISEIPKHVNVQANDHFLLRLTSGFIMKWVMASTERFHNETLVDGQIL